MARTIQRQEEQSIRLVSWPSPQDYNEAIQNPSYVFDDAELAYSVPLLNSLGLPKPATGNFATVYKLVSPDSGTALAVRCFLHPPQDQQERYRALSNFLQNAPLPYCVKCQFIEQGMLVHDEWLPIVKMQWVSGQSLLEYVGSIKNDHGKLTECAEKFRQMVLCLSASGIAHGDLQHGNIIIDNDEIRLVDYDGVFVPELAGQPSNELGHSNYQHPQRNSEFFSEKLDRFSAWIIYASLIILSRDATLWKLLDAGDECLVFRHCDYVNPTHSATFYALETHNDPHIRMWSKYIRSLLMTRIENIPNLDVLPDIDMQFPELLPVECPQASFVLSTALPSQSAENGATATDQSPNTPAHGSQFGSTVFNTASAIATSSLQTIGASASSTTSSGNAATGSPTSGITSLTPATSSQNPTETDLSRGAVAALITCAVLVFIGLILCLFCAAERGHDQATEYAAVSSRATTKNDTLPSCPSARSQIAMQKVKNARKQDDGFAMFNYSKEALAENRKDKALSEEQIGECWHMIGRWQYDHTGESNDYGAAAFRNAYDEYAKFGLKYTNILDDLEQSYLLKNDLLGCSQTAFEAIRASFTGGVDQTWGEAVGADQEIDYIVNFMPGALKANPEEALNLYKAVVNYLQPSDRDSNWVRSRKHRDMWIFANGLCNRIDEQINSEHLDTARQMTKVLSMCVDGSDDWMESFKAAYKWRLQQLAKPQ